MTVLITIIILAVLFAADVTLAIIDYIFILIYVWVATAVINSVISLIKRYKNNGSICTEDITRAVLFLLGGIGAALIHNKFFN